uniref:Uncharacterized protein n=1 Tax=Rhizophora mucronata TaxID=61149 RepID=A0A2P2LA60_RHIMU
MSLIQTPLKVSLPQKIHKQSLRFSKQTSSVVNREKHINSSIHIHVPSLPMSNVLDSSPKLT